jgi:hypothetical protein
VEVLRALWRRQPALEAILDQPRRQAAGDTNGAAVVADVLVDYLKGRER